MMPYPIATKQHVDAPKQDADEQRSPPLSVSGFDGAGRSTVTAGCFLGAITAGTMPRLGLTVSTSSAIAAGTPANLRRPLASSRKRPHPGVGVEAAEVQMNGVVEQPEEHGNMKAPERQKPFTAGGPRDTFRHESGASPILRTDIIAQQEGRGDADAGAGAAGDGGWPGSPTACCQLPKTVIEGSSSQRYFQQSSDEEHGGGPQTCSSRPTTPGLTPETGNLPGRGHTPVVEGEGEGEAGIKFTSAVGGSNAKRCGRRKQHIGEGSNVPASGSESPSTFQLAMSQDPPRLLDLSSNSGEGMAIDSNNGSGPTAAVGGEKSGNGGRHVVDKAAVSRRLDSIIAAYANTDSPPTKKKRRAKRTRGGGRSAGVGGSDTREAEAAAVAERMRELEALMDVAMTSPVTYEAQVRRERLARLRMMYTVEREMATLPVEFLRGAGYEVYGTNLRLSRMCGALTKSHRWSRVTAFSRWRKLLERALADKFAEEMLSYEHERLISTLSATKERLEKKQIRRRFSRWRRCVRLAQMAEDQARFREAATAIQRWAQRQLTIQRHHRALQARQRKRSLQEREKAEAVAAVLSFEDCRRETLWRTFRSMEEKRHYDANHRAATELQHAWLRHENRCQLLEVAEVERQELKRCRLAEQARRWVVVFPMVEGFLLECLDRSRRAALAKTRAGHENARLIYEVELAEYRRVLASAQAVIRHAWAGKRTRLEFLSRRAALMIVQRAWRRAYVRRTLEREIGARVVATAARMTAEREAAARFLQSVSSKWADRRRLQNRFAARRAKLDFERRNRTELASAVLVLSGSSAAVRDFSALEDFKAMEDAVMPAAAVARMRAIAASRGLSLENMSGLIANAAAEEDEPYDGEDDARLGGELARAVLQQVQVQNRAAAGIQGAFRRRRARRELEERFRLRKVKLETQRREGGARTIQRCWASLRLREEIAARVERTRLKIAAERDAGARRLQKFCRRRKDAKELAARFVIRKIILEQARSMREMNAAATTIQLWYRRRVAVYYMTLRIVARYQLATKRATAAEQDRRRCRDESAKTVQRAWRKRKMRVYLSTRFEARAARLSREKEAAARQQAAVFLQGWWHRLQARRMLSGRFANRARLMIKQQEQEEKDKREDAAARVLQMAWSRHDVWKHMSMRFRVRRKVLDDYCALEESKRLELENLENEKKEAERRMHREHEATKVKLLLEEAEKKRKADEAASHLLDAWKLGYDQENSRNYWFNHVTGESSTTKPEGWTLKPSERWLKQTNDKGLAYYLDLETGETHWFPPCEQCYKCEGEKTCSGCENQIYCSRCWTKEHNSEDMAGHQWKGADSGKEDLQPGERHCVDCGFRKAKWVCLQCKDAMCGECNARIHGSGHRKSHQVEAYAKSKKGWQTVEGRTDNEPTFFFNATTNESTFDKPEELMLPEELAEHKRFLEYKETSEKYVKKIEKLQFQVEELMYEKDKIAFQWANAQKDMKATTGGGEGLSLPSLGGMKLGGRKKNNAKDAAKSPLTSDQEEAYRKSLLISRKDKREMGFEVKLKKQAVTDS